MSYLIALLRSLPRSLVPSFRRPARVVLGSFATIIAVGAVLLSLPVASAGSGAASPVTALFTATSAVCVTGLIVVDTPSYWSTFGELVILGLIQVGGFGIMTLASLLGLAVARRMSLRLQLSAQVERKSLGVGQMRQVVVGVARTSVLFEICVAAVLCARLWAGYDEPFGRAAYLGGFHAVSAFNSAGFALYSDSLMRFVTDPWICVPVAVAVLFGGLGFPVLFELRRHLRVPHHWSLHAKLTLGMTLILLVIAGVAVTAGEWANPATLGGLGAPGKLLAGFFQASMRTAGFNTVEIGEMNPATLLSLDVLMFIGGGSASTAGGIKVTTFALLGFVILAEIRAEPDVGVLGRRLPRDIQRQALTVALLSVGAVVIFTTVLLAIAPFTLDRVLFEAISAFGTVGWSTGITPQLSDVGKLLVTAAMFAGRLGPATVASALALRERTRRYELPEERPIVG